MTMSWRMPLYRLLITAWYTLPTMTLHACCMTHGRINMSVNFSAVYNDRRASGHGCFWMRRIEHADCRLAPLLSEYSWEVTASALIVPFFRFLVTAAATSSAYAVSLPACTSSLVLATPCIKRPGHVSVHGAGDCDGLSCGLLANLCMLSHELRPASMMSRSHHWGSASCPAPLSLPSLVVRTCPAPALLWCASAQRRTLLAMLDPTSLCPPRRLCVVGFTPACWCFSRTRAGPTRTLGSSSPRLPISWSRWKAGTFWRGFGSCRRDGMCLALCRLSRSDLEWALACVFDSSKTPLCHPPPHRCQRPLMMRRLPGLGSWQATAVSPMCCLWRCGGRLFGRCCWS